MKRNKIVELLASLGLLLIAAGIMLPLFKGLDFTPFRYIYAAGAAIALIARLIGVNAPAGEPTRLRRMRRLEKWSAIFLLRRRILPVLRPRHRARRAGVHTCRRRGAGHVLDYDSET